MTLPATPVATTTNFFARGTKVVADTLQRWRGARALKAHDIAEIDRVLKLARRRRGVEGAVDAILFVVLDDVETMVEAYGTAIESDIIRWAAASIERSVRRDDVRVRIGWYHFVVMLRGITSSEGAFQAAERIRQAIADPFVQGGFAASFTASVGVALVDEAGQQIALRRALAAGTAARAAGGDCVRFAEERAEELARATAGVAQKLRDAVTTSVLDVHYQPIVALGSGQVVGVEALSRWCDDGLGHVPPAVFIPVATRTSLIDQLTRQVITHALATAASWKAPNHPLTSAYVSVNLAEGQLRSRDFISELLVRAAAQTVAGPRLQVEILETAALDDRAVQDNVRRLHDAGVRVALDDFGTGYASLHALARMRIDTVKIDRSFVAAAPRSPTDAAIVESIVVLGRQLGMTVVAEGVETDAQRRILMSLGCAYAQGFLFSPALARDHLEVFAAGRVSPARQGPRSPVRAAAPRTRLAAAS